MKKTLASPPQKTVFDHADRFFQQGNFTHALHLYRQVNPKECSPEINQKIEACIQHLLKKYWRQGKADEMAHFAKEYHREEEIKLALAKLQGQQAVEALAESGDGILSRLAQCSLQSDLKSALLVMRQEPTLKEIAEGWLALSKNDCLKALNSFSSAHDKAPIQSQIGQAICLLASGKIREASPLLDHLKPFASRFFPQLNKAAQWDSLHHAEDELIQHYLFHCPLQELLAVEKKLPPQKRALRGWIWLRAGDYLYCRKHSQSDDSTVRCQKACQAWSRALYYHPDLELDVLKRRFLVSDQKGSSLDSDDAFSKFYCALFKKSSADAKAFVDQLISNFFSYSRLDPDVIRCTKDRWIINPPPLELQCLWLILTFHQRLYKLTLSLFLEECPPEKYTGETWENWEALFLQLDPQYSSTDAYLQAKCGVAILHRQLDVVRSSLVQRLKINPSLKSELLPQYIKTVWRCLPSILSRKDLQFRTEIDALLQQFPCDYDLLYLKILLSPHTMENEIRRATSYLSKPLGAVLQCHLSINSPSLHQKKCIALLNEGLLERDREAGWRFLAVLCHPKAKFSKKKMSESIETLALDSRTLHEYASNVYAHYDQVLPISIIKKYLKGTYFHYHLALYYLNTGNYSKCWEQLSMASDTLSVGHPEFVRMDATLSLHTPPTPEFEEFMQKFLDRFGGC